MAGRAYCRGECQETEKFGLADCNFGRARQSEGGWTPPPLGPEALALPPQLPRPGISATVEVIWSGYSGQNVADSASPSRLRN